jgi:deoxyribodipyrimidine photo-lyase
MTRPVLVWFRKDLRFGDNPALHHAVEKNAPVIPLFIDETDDPWAPGDAARWWLKRSILSLNIDFWLRRGKASDIILDIVKKHDVQLVTWNRRFEPFGIETDTAIKTAFKERGIEVTSFNGSLGREPFEVATQAGDPYKVYTPYSRSWLAQGDLPEPLPAARKFETLSDPDPVDPDEWLPDEHWSTKFDGVAEPGEDAARNRLDSFIEDGVKRYGRDRDRPDKDGVSRLSPHLHWGEITPRQIYAAILREHGGIEPAMAFVRQLVWRDFAHHNMYYFKNLAETSLRREFEDYPWVEDDMALDRWQRGETGFPIVDAGMRELWATGYMHNRVRMIVGSFLTKDLRIHWRHGAKWFWDTLFDADLANNSMGWQWVAGSGIDAAPYFRIFNPWTQSEKFDPAGTYIRRWVPELKNIKGKAVHNPHDADFGGPGGYPRPMVDHKRARELALEGYQSLRS